MSREDARPPATPPADLAAEIGKEHPFDLPGQEAYLNLIRTRSVLAGDFAPVFRDAGLGEAQYNALRIAVAAGADGVRIDTIRRRLVDRDPDVSRIVDRLARADLVVREGDPDDRRAVRIVATPEGRRLAERLRDKLDAIHRTQFSHLSDGELAELNRLLFKARQRGVD